MTAVVASSAVVAISGLHTARVTAAEVTDKRPVRVVYFVPSDQPEQPIYRQALVDGVSRLQAWYRNQLDGATFSITAKLVETCRGTETAAWYGADAWGRVFAAVQACTGGARTSTGEFRGMDWDDPRYRWIVYADVVNDCGHPESRLGAGTNGVAMMPRQDLQGLSGQQTITDDCGKPWTFKHDRWIGGLAHELGHALTLPHPPGCDQGLSSCDFGSVMSVGLYSFPNTYFRDDERAVLTASPFITRAAVGLTSAASYRPADLAPGALASLFAGWIANDIASVKTASCTTTLAQREIWLRDSAGVDRAACLLYVGRDQINWQIPEDAAVGAASIRVVDTSNGRTLAQIDTAIAPAAPAVFVRDGGGLAGYVVRARGGANTNEALDQPIQVADPDSSAYLIVYTTGARAVTSSLRVTIGGRTQQVVWAGAAPGLRGLEQLNVRLDPSLAGAGRVDLAVEIDEAGSVRRSNSAGVTIA